MQLNPVFRRHFVFLMFSFPSYFMALAEIRRWVLSTPNTPAAASKAVSRLHSVFILSAFLWIAGETICHSKCVRTPLQTVWVSNTAKKTEACHSSVGGQTPGRRLAVQGGQALCQERATWQGGSRAQMASQFSFLPAGSPFGLSGDCFSTGTTYLGMWKHWMISIFSFHSEHFCQQPTFKIVSR